MKQKVAVVFGGTSPEHDVSVITGLQALNALDSSKYEGFPVYITAEGHWLTGDVLRERGNYMLDAARRKQTTRVTPALAARKPTLMPMEPSAWSFRKQPAVEFDVALLALHGGHGEDGSIQGLLDVCGIPYTGTRPMASAVLMDKAATKLILKALGIPALPHVAIDKPDPDRLAAFNQELGRTVDALQGPWCVKPAHLGSSIGVAQANNTDELGAVLLNIFRLDSQAVVEPFVPNLVEYNVAVRNGPDGPITSAIERPKRSGELLDFVQKYGSGVGPKTGLKQPGAASQGMLSLSREIGPALPQGREQEIRDWASRICAALGLAGTPRVDFLGNAETGEIWLNEVNTMPGSFAYYLWEAAPKPMLFTELMDELIAEALAMGTDRRSGDDPVPKEARLFPRRE